MAPTSASSSKLPTTSPEHRRIAAQQFERANQVVQTGSYEYGIRLLLTCCKLDPGNLTYRQALRRTEKAKYKDNLRGSFFSWLTIGPSLAKMKASLTTRDYVKVLEHGETVLRKNPWHVGAQMDMAVAADHLGLLDMAIWTLEQARQKMRNDANLNRALARLYEKRGNFTQAMRLWELVREARPTDQEAANKAKDLAASDTIARGQYEANAARAIAQPQAATAPETGAAHPGPAAAQMQAARKSGAAAAPSTPFAPPVDRGVREVDTIKAKIDADPTNVNNYLQLASIHRRQNDLDSARALLEQGLSATGNAWDLIVALAEVDIDGLRRDLAMTEGQLKAAPDDAALVQLRDQQQKEVWSRELEVYRRKAERYPTEMVHRFELGVRLFRLAQVDEAIKELQASRSDPRHKWQSLFFLGRCFKARNNWRLAQRNYEEALQAIPANEVEQRKDLLYELACGCAEANEYGRARELGHELANTDFAYRDIAQRLEEWERRADH
jgi:tetratricopeptide (TPR) repeat protein